MKEYSIAVILWNDHMGVTRAALPKNPEDIITPVLSVGIIIEETLNLIVLASEIEHYEERDDVSYVLILKPTIISRKIYGTIKIRKPRKE